MTFRVSGWDVASSGIVAVVTDNTLGVMTFGPYCLKCGLNFTQRVSIHTFRELSSKYVLLDISTHDNY